MCVDYSLRTAQDNYVLKELVCSQVNPSTPRIDSLFHRRGILAHKVPLQSCSKSTIHMCGPPKLLSQKRKWEPVCKTGKSRGWAVDKLERLNFLHRPALMHTQLK